MLKAAIGLLRMGKKEFISKQRMYEYNIVVQLMGFDLEKFKFFNRLNIVQLKYGYAKRA